MPHDVRGLIAAAAGYSTLTRELTTPSPVLLTLKQSAAGKVSGRVLDATGGSVPGALVSARVPGASGGLSLAQTDPNGAFALQIDAPEVELTAQADAYSIGSRSVRVPAEAVDIVLAPGAGLCGRVIARNGGGAVEGARVRATNDNGLYFSPPTLRTAAGGSFCQRQLPAGGYTLWVEGGGWRSERSWHLVRPHEEVSDVVLEASPAGSLSARLSVGNEPCREGSVALQGVERFFARTTRDGVALLDGLPPGAYRALVYCDAAAPLQESIEIGLEPIAKDWALAAGLELQGKVVRASGKPMAGIGVFVTPDGKLAEQAHAVPLRVLSDEQGAFRAQGLLAGEYALSLDGPAQAILPPVRVAVGEHPEPVVLVAAPEAEIRATFAQGAASRAPLGVLAQGESPAWIEADQRGEQFVLEHLALGTYRVLAAGSPADTPGEAVTLRHDGERVDLTLPAAGAPQVISGRVLDESGLPVLDAWVTARSLYPLTFASPAPALTNERGEFSIAVLASGPHRLEVSNELGQAVAPNVSAGASVDVRLLRFGALVGTVLTPSAEPARRALLTLKHESGQTRELQVSDGAWQLTWAAPGRYELEVASAEGAASGGAVLESGGRLEIALQLRSR